MPKQKITKEMVVDVAFEIARRNGMEKVMVKSIADKLGCSVQPNEFAGNSSNILLKIRKCHAK